MIKAPIRKSMTGYLYSYFYIAHHAVNTSNRQASQLLPKGTILRERRMEMIIYAPRHKLGLCTTYAHGHHHRRGSMYIVSSKLMIGSHWH